MPKSWDIRLIGIVTTVARWASSVVFPFGKLKVTYIKGHLKPDTVTWYFIWKQTNKQFIENQKPLIKKNVKYSFPLFYLSPCFLVIS